MELCKRFDLTDSITVICGFSVGRAVNPAGFWPHYNIALLTYLLTYLI